MKVKDLRQQKALLAKCDHMESSLRGFRKLTEGLGYQRNESFSISNTPIWLNRDSIDVIIKALEAEVERLNEVEL